MDFHKAQISVASCWMKQHITFQSLLWIKTTILLMCKVEILQQNFDGNREWIQFCITLSMKIPHQFLMIEVEIIIIELGIITVEHINHWQDENVLNWLEINQNIWQFRIQFHSRQWISQSVSEWILHRIQQIIQNQYFQNTQILEQTLIYI